MSRVRISLPAFNLINNEGSTYALSNGNRKASARSRARSHYARAVWLRARSPVEDQQAKVTAVDDPIIVDVSIRSCFTVGSPDSKKNP